jgi:hypothetical protein
MDCPDNNEREVQSALTPDCAEDGRVEVVHAGSTPVGNAVQPPLKTRVCAAMSRLTVWLAVALLSISAPSVIRSMWLRAGLENHASTLEPKAAEKTEVPLGDKYGGTTAHVQKGTGYFTIAKVGSRWTFVTPDGNAFWLRSVYHAIAILNPGVLDSKYQGNMNLWATQRNRRLLSWGFNALGEYTAGRGVPVGTFGNLAGNPVKLPFLLEVNALVYSQDQRNLLGLASPTKNIVRGVPRTTYNGWPGRTMDLFDPQLPKAYRALLAVISKQYTGGFAQTPWVIGITPDDSDFMFGLKTGGEGAVVKHPHPVFLIACTKFDYSSAEDPYGREFKDRKLYSKYAWVAFLQKKYTTIRALNAAWGSDYSSFDDDGGYGMGKGLLDEDGRHRAWMGSDPYMLSNAKPSVRADMDAFLYEFVRRYADTAVSAIREVDRNHLIFSPMCLNSAGNPARDQVLRAMGDGGIQVFCLSYDPLRPDLSGNSHTYDLTGKPAFLWYGVSANRDSQVHAFKIPGNIPDFGTQQERAAAYARDLKKFYGARAANGDAYIVGINFWELNDSFGEKTNWGLVTRNDNPYDGKAAVRSAGTDQWGFHTGGEDQDYGDFLSTVRSTNFEIQERLTRDLTPLAQSPAKSQK